MRILWITNILPHFLAEKLAVNTINNLGWLDYSAEMLTAQKDVQISLAFPASNLPDGVCDRISYYTFLPRYNLHRNDAELKKRFQQIIETDKPEVIHIYGTEYYHTVAAIKAAEEMGILDRTVVSIQGLVSVYAEHYLAGIPYWTTRFFTVRDILKRENLVGQKKKYEIRGAAEIEALKRCRHVIGRTQWDKACTEQLNPNITYHFCNETLRKDFYTDQWDYNSCQKHSVFVSQSSYSIKGLHQAVKALPLILKQFPDTKIYVTGQDVFTMKWYRINSYHYYLKRLISKLHLRDRVIFMGELNGVQMKQAFLRSHVFLLCSSIENSPNSLGEAMILGVPSVAADVGGVINLFDHESDGFLYPHDEPYMLAHYIMRIFSDTDMAERMSAHAREHALSTHAPQKNMQRLCDIYYSLID